MKKEWETEPNVVKFEYNGLKCFILRHSSFLHLCGYVGLPPSHFFYEKKNIEQLPLNIHGGITFSEFGDGSQDNLFEKGYHWIGFDCNHSFDFVPGAQFFDNQTNLSYKNIDFAIREVKSLAKQLDPINITIKKLIQSD